jgi:hypothetical protein
LTGWLAGASPQRRLIVMALCWCAGATHADAQVTISGGLAWLGGYPVGTSTAQLRTNAPGAVTPALTLFSVSSRIAPSVAGGVRIGVGITSSLTVEGGAAIGRQRLAFSISGDRESPSQQLEGESVWHYLFDAGLAWQLGRPRGTRLRTFVLGGAGYQRQLHQDRTLVESGQLLYAGAGARYWVWGRPDSSRSLGVRVDARANLRRHGIDFENKTRLYPSLSLLLFLAL